MTGLELTLDDISPRDSSPFSLSSAPDRKLTLRRFSLRVRRWALEKFGGPKQIEKILKTQSIDEMAELAFFMLDDASKKFFKDEDDFFDAILTVKDHLAVSVALLEAIGLGEPVLNPLRKKIEDVTSTPLQMGETDPNGQSPKP